MIKSRCAVTLFLTLLCGCVAFPEVLDQNTSSFIQLLVREKPATLAEASLYGGECGGESELNFMIKECQRSWGSKDSKDCQKFSRYRCSHPDKVPSLELEWVRNHFATAGKDYRVIKISHETDGFPHDLIDVEIGPNVFSLFYNSGLNAPTGLVVGISEVNGRKIEDYLQ